MQIEAVFQRFGGLSLANDEMARPFEHSSNSLLKQGDHLQKQYGAPKRTNFEPCV